MYASGTWYDNYELPADKTRYGAFTGLAERSEEQVKNIIDGLMEKSSLNAEEKLVHDFFVAYMDTTKKVLSQLKTYSRLSIALKTKLT